MLYPKMSLTTRAADLRRKTLILCLLAVSLMPEMATAAAGSRAWLDGPALDAGPPPGFAVNVYWNGAGGDIWNTNSSPFTVETTNPLSVLWSGTSQDEGEFHRASGICLADVGDVATPYLFGSTGWGQNRAYRRQRDSGNYQPWVTQDGNNDSGTGFRVALSLDGSVLYHIDCGSRIRAYPTATDPAGAPTWSVDGAAVGLAKVIKVGPDGLIYGHGGGIDRLGAALDPATGQCVWWMVGDPELIASPGAFWNTGTTYHYVVAGGQTIAAYDIAQPAGSPAVWSFQDTEESGWASPTIDPVTGAVYAFRDRCLLKLDAMGQLQWRSIQVPAGETGRAGGALARDGQTYYYQTGTETNTGQLYAFRTADGGMKWSYPTGARISYDLATGSPVVSANGVVLVANGAYGVDGDNRIICVEDSAGVAPVLRDTFDLRDDGGGGPYVSIGPGGVVYFDGWGLPDNPRVFACQSHDVMLPAPIQQRAVALNHRVRVRWEPVTDSGIAFAAYRIYRATQPFETVAGLTPVGTVPSISSAEYVDETAENGIAYWYSVTTLSSSGGEFIYAPGVGPRTPRDETDLQVVSVARTPRFPRYDPTYNWYYQTDQAGFGPYGFSAATGLGSDQTLATQRWPLTGEPVQYTATVRNRGTNTAQAQVTGTWRVDGISVGEQMRAATMAPGDTLHFQLARTWDGLDHEIEFQFTSDQPESRTANNQRSVAAMSVGFLTYIDETNGEMFREESSDFPLTVTDDVVDWMNHHIDRFNDMFAAAGSQKRVHYEILEVIDDFAPDPAMDRLPFAIFPFRMRWNEGSMRHTGYYRADEDIDFGLLHEQGHQLGLVDLYRLSLGPDQNLVNSTGYSPPECLMNGCSPFLSEHSARAMNHWYDSAHGYYGQYLYCIPEVVRLRLVGFGGVPLQGAVVTVYQKAEREGLGEVVTDQVRAQITADAQGIITLPNVPIVSAEIPPTAAGDELHANPFGNLAVVATNGLLLLKVEHQGFTDWCWLDITEVNNAYWSGQTGVATIDRQLGLGGDIQNVPPAELTELNAASWDAWAAVGTVTLSDDVSLRQVGAASIKGVFTGGFDNYVRYPGDQLAAWDLRGATHLRAWFYAENPNGGFQELSPWFRLNCPGGSIDLKPPYDLLNSAIGEWFEVLVPLAGDGFWQRIDHGQPSLQSVTSLDIHADTWGGGFTLWIDGVGFWPRPTTAHTISGTVTGPPGTNPGVIVRPYPTAGTGGPVETDADGAYVLAVSIDWNGYVQPEHPSLSFNPVRRQYAALTQDQVGQDYVAAGPGAVFNGWQMHQRDMQHTGRADFTVPTARLNSSFFDLFNWQTPTPGSPWGEGGLGATSMTFADSVGPNGADIVVGGYHWPKGVQGMDRHTGEVFWAGLPDGGESIGDRSPAFAPDGQTIYVTNDATESEQYPDGHPFMAFGTNTGPATFRHNGDDALPHHLDEVNPVVAPDGRIFLHGWTLGPSGATDDGAALRETWTAQTTMSCVGNDAALFQDGDSLRVIMGSEYGIMACFDGNSGAELWQVDTPVIIATATVDPATGRIYVPAGNESISVVGLSRLGEPLWGQAAQSCYEYTGSNDPQRAVSAGCLSHDGQTYYFQTNGLNGPGALYAINTTNGAVKWTYPTGAIGWDDPAVSSPIVTRNGVVIVGNNRGDTYYALLDEGDNVALLDTLTVDAAGNARASATISEDGHLYLPLRTTWTVAGGGLVPSGEVANLFCSLDIASTGTPVPGSVPTKWSLLQNHPNPFNPQTVIAFELVEASAARLRIYDVAGRAVRTLIDGQTLDAGRREVSWDGRDDAGNPVAAGVYHYRLVAGSYSESRSMVLLK